MYKNTLRAEQKLNANNSPSPEANADPSPSGDSRTISFRLVSFSLIACASLHCHFLFRTRLFAISVDCKHLSCALACGESVAYYTFFHHSRERQSVLGGGRAKIICQCAVPGHSGFGSVLGFFPGFGRNDIEAGKNGISAWLGREVRFEWSFCRAATFITIVIYDNNRNFITEIVYRISGVPPVLDVLVSVGFFISFYFSPPVCLVDTLRAPSSRNTVRLVRVCTLPECCC